MVCVCVCGLRVRAHQCHSHSNRPEWFDSIHSLNTLQKRDWNGKKRRKKKRHHAILCCYPSIVTTKRGKFPCRFSTLARIKIGLIENFNENFDERDWNFNVGVPCNEYTRPEAIQWRWAGGSDGSDALKELSASKNGGILLVTASTLSKHTKWMDEWMDGRTAVAMVEGDGEGSLQTVSFILVAAINHSPKRREPKRVHTLRVFLASTKSMAIAKWKHVYRNEAKSKWRRWDAGFKRSVKT